MNLQWKVLGPLALYGLALLAYLAWRWLPGEAGTALVLPVALGLAGMLGLACLLLQREAVRPLASLSRACKAPLPPPPDGAREVLRLARGIRDLWARLEGQQAEAAEARRESEAARAALKNSEERFALALRSASEGLWEWNLQSDELVLSPRWKGMLGFGEEELPNLREAWRQRVHPQDLAPVEAALSAHLEGRTPRYEEQLRLLHRDGRYRWVLSRGCALRHANGRPYRMVGLDTDITRVKRVENILEQVVEGTSGAYGEVFFRSLVRHFAAALEVSCAFITECADHPPTRLRTLAFWRINTFADNFEYALPGTPCETVVKEGRTCFYPTGVGRNFPREAAFEGYLGIPIFGSDGRVLGHLAFLNHQEMTEDMLADAVFRIFTARAGAELERKQALARLGPATAAERSL